VENVIYKVLAAKYNLEHDFIAEIISEYYRLINEAKTKGEIKGYITIEGINMNAMGSSPFGQRPRPRLRKPILTGLNDITEIEFEHFNKVMSVVIDTNING